MLCIGVLGEAHGASLKVSIQGDRVSLHADRVSLMRVLETIGRKANIRIESNDPLTKPVSLDLSGLSVEDSLRRLLAKQNYTLIFKKTAETVLPLQRFEFLPQGPKISPDHASNRKGSPESTR